MRSPLSQQHRGRGLVSSIEVRHGGEGKSHVAGQTACRSNMKRTASMRGI
jgi:hypothetical protein